MTSINDSRDVRPSTSVWQGVFFHASAVFLCEKSMKYIPRFGFAFVGFSLCFLSGPNGQATASSELSKTGLSLGFDASTSRSYNFVALRLLDRVRYFVEDKYVDPERIDPAAMFDAALKAVEWNQSGVLFQREKDSKLLHIAVENYLTTLEIPQIEDLKLLSDQLSRVAEVLDAHLSADIERPSLEYAFINGMLSTLDPHSSLLPPEVSKEWEVENQGEFGGLGITIQMRDGWLTVQYPLKDTPAFRAGLKSEDRIIRIEDESTINMELQEAVSRLRGPVGSPVNITVDREGFSRPKVFTIVRATIRMNPVEGLLMEGGIGYVQVDNFHAAASRDLAALLAQLKRRNRGELKGLVLDLRGNPGGYLHQAIEISDMFLSDGTIVSTVEGSRRDPTFAKRGGTEGDYPVVILVNANSASASEIVAGALKKRQRAVIVGERTFGKGSVQHVYPNGDDSRLKMTVSKYLTPGDESIQGVGISPDILLRPSLVEMVEDEENGSKDPLVALNWRDRVSREADLDKAFDWANISIESPVYEVRYLRTRSDEERQRSDDLHVADDWEVQFAKDLILNVTNSRRADMLVAASDVVERANKAESVRINKAFDELGVDWSSGTQPKAPDLVLALELENDKVLSGKDLQELRVTVTNQGEEPVYQLLAEAKSEVGFVDGEEFFFGKLEPGEQRSWTRTLRGIDGQSDRLSEVVFSLRDGSGVDFGEKKARLSIQGNDKPDFAFSLSSRDRGEDCGGNGNKKPEKGETVCLDLKVTNVGSGDAPEVFARLRNRAGPALDLSVGTAELGALKVGESKEATFVFEVRGDKSVLPVELSLGDNQRYEYDAVMRGGFYDYFVQVLPIDLQQGKATELSLHPPSVKISRQPESLVGISQAVISGVVEDEGGLSEVLVFHGDDKVFVQSGGEEIRSLPFTVDLDLKVGENLVVVMAKDSDGLTDIRAVNLFYDPEHTVTKSPGNSP